jgi:mannose-6-phosphate isomerase-like protein (cupin superfamily)
LDRGFVKASVDDGIGSLSLMEIEIEPGFLGPAPQRHESMIDSFRVLDGTLTLRIEERTLEAGPGTFASIPSGVAHTFSNPGREPVRLLEFMAPGGDFVLA